MNREDVIAMAREAHHELVTQDYPGHLGQLDPWTMRLLERFAALVAAAEREACAKVAETPVGEYEVIVACGTDPVPHRIPRYLEWNSIAAAIRARGQA